MNDLISRQDAIDAIEEIRSCIWDVDIPSPTVPEYIEHHKQMQELMDRCDTLRRNLENLQSAKRKRGKNISKDGFLCSVCTFGDFGGFHGYEPNFCPNCGTEMKHD